MPSLADYKGGKYLGPGDHLVTVMSYEPVDSEKCQTEGMTFHLETNTGSGIDETFWITEKALGRLSSFADACGLSEETKRHYDPWQFASHKMLVSRRVWVRIVKPDKYAEVDDWWAMDAQAPAQQPTSTPAVAPVQQGPEDKDIPF